MSAMVLMYHSIGAEGGFANIAISEFRKHIEWINENYDIVGLPSRFENATTGDETVAITFDDGLVSFYENAEPVLSEYSTPATVFVLSAAIKRPDSIGIERIIDDRLTTPEALMSYEQLTRLTENPLITIGAHSITHPELSTLDTSEKLKKEIAGSKEVLESKLDVCIDQFSYPFGDWNDEAYEIVSDTYSYGYAVQINGHTPIITQNTDPHLIPRVHAGVELSRLQQLITDLSKN